METKERIMPDKAVTLIDLDDIIRTRAGKKAKYIPGFLINGLKRLIHQDFINEYLRQGYVGVDFCEHTLAYLDVKVKVDGKHFRFIPKIYFCVQPSVGSHRRGDFGNGARPSLRRED